MAGSGDEMAGAGGHRHLRVSHADREQVIHVLKAAFVQGRLAKDEFDLRIGQALASRTYVELTALTADVPAGPTRARPPEPARESKGVPAPKTVARVTAAGAGASMALIGAELIVNGGNPVVGLLVVGLTGSLVAVLIAALLTFLSRVLEKSSGMRPSQGAPPRASSAVAQQLAAADSAGQLPQISHDPRHTAEAARNRLPRPAIGQFADTTSMAPSRASSDTSRQRMLVILLRVGLAPGTGRRPGCVRRLPASGRWPWPAT
jgi:hypothetical protein